MSFIRVKGRGNRRYAYLVSEIWTKDGPRQKVSSYLGKVIRPEQEKQLSFYDVCDEKTLKSLDFRALVLKLVELELLRHGFHKNKNVFLRDFNAKKLIADLEKVSFTYKNSEGSREKNAVLQLNQGFLCDRTIKELIRIGSERGECRKNGNEGNDLNDGSNNLEESDAEFFDEKIDGFALAKLVVNSGLDVEKGIFLKLYEKCINRELGLELPESLK